MDFSSLDLFSWELIVVISNWSIFPINHTYTADSHRIKQLLWIEQEGETKSFNIIRHKFMSEVAHSHLWVYSKSFNSDNVSHKYKRQISWWDNDDIRLNAICRLSIVASRIMALSLMRLVCHRTMRDQPHISSEASSGDGRRHWFIFCCPSYRFSISFSFFLVGGHTVRETIPHFDPGHKQLDDKLIFIRIRTFL